MKTIPNTLRGHRKSAELLQSDVAQKLGFTTTERISRWEKGLSYPSVVNLLKLAKLYGVTAEELYQEDASSIPLKGSLEGFKFE